LTIKKKMVELKELVVKQLGKWEVGNGEYKTLMFTTLEVEH
jgi:hypothetical protein